MSRTERIAIWLVQPARRAYVAVIFLMLIVAATLGFWRVSVVTDQVNANQQANTEALCALRADLQARVNSSTDFLAKHPHGVSGISAATIQASIDNELRTIHALSPLVCPAK